MIDQFKKMAKSTNEIKNNNNKQMKISSNKSKSSRPITNPTPSKLVPRNMNTKRNRKNTKHVEDIVRDIRHLNVIDLISKSATVITEISSHSKLKNENFEKDKNKELDTKLTPKVLDGLMERLTHMKANFEESLQTVKTLGNLMKEISNDFKSLSKAMNDNIYLLQHNTIQKFHALENKEKKMIKKYQFIEYMVKKFKDELEKTRKSFNVIRSKQ
nr:uncharacterized protein LOC106684694 isoform X2 [Halyomorpha halys]